MKVLYRFLIYTEPVSTLLPARTAILLALHQPFSGVELMERLSSIGLPLGCGSIYPALQGLEAEGLVRSWDQPLARGRPRRNYELTVAGVRAAADAERTLGALLSRPRRATEPDEAEAMAARLRECDELSQFALGLSEGLS